MTDYADRIANSTPLPATWRAGVNMTDDLMEMIADYGAECARHGYALAFGQVAA